MAEKTTKLTYKEVIGKVLEIEEVQANAEYVEALTKLKTSLEKKSAGKSKKATQEQVDIMNEIIRVLGATDKATISQLVGMSELLSQYTPNKVSAMVTKLKNEVPARVIRTVEKKVAYFSLPTEIDNEEETEIEE